MKSIVPTPMRGPALSVMLCGLLACAPGEALADTHLGIIGGPGGAPFEGGCPPDQNLGGFELRTGDYIDAIRPVCVISLGPREIKVAPVQPPFFGGPGGGNRWLVCPQHKPIVIGMYIHALGKEFVTVDTIRLYCDQAPPSAQQATSDSLVTYSSPSISLPFNGKGLNSTHGVQSCPAGQVAIGVHGRSGTWLDSVGLICDVPRLTAPHVGGVPRLPGDRAIGRGGPTVTPAPTVTVVPVARPGSTLSPWTEAAPAKKVGRAEGPSVTPPAPTRPICDVAHEARTLNSSAAPDLERQCRAELAALAAKGEAIAKRDPLSAELRRRTRSDLARRGFDIGMAASEGDTAPGPGKQAIHNALTGIEQAAFDAAVSFSLQRNKNAQLAATGAAIARADSAVEKARTADKDVFYWLGFDIATGIFGDSAQGALGNTATGPGSLAIRNALDAVAQRGFNASVDLHLRRNGVKGDPASIAAKPANGLVTPNSRNDALMNQGKAVTPAGAPSPTTPLLSAPSPLGAGGTALNQPVVQAPTTARPLQQKANAVSLNPQPLPPASPTLLPAQMPTTLK